MVSDTNKRVRTLKACDQCRTARTKCDGTQPCRRCLSLAKSCEYFSQRKKRGRGSELYSRKREKNNQQAGAVDNDNDNDDDNDNANDNANDNDNDNDYFLDNTIQSDIVDINLSSLQPIPDDNSNHAFDFLPPVMTDSFNSPRWLNIDTLFPTELFVSSHSPRRDDDATPTTIQYPVLRPILSQLDFIQPELIDDLIEVYFSNTVYGIAPIIRKSSLLSTTHPRACTPALLFSFLLVSAHATDHSLIKATASTRETITSRLSDLVISHMKPLHSGNDLDDVITYIHLGILASMSEFKGPAMRWWHGAFTLARLLKLNIENPSLDEERREEQRRTWWLLFLTDRHLSLCYNLNPSTLDSECTELYVPIDEKRWSSDEPLSANKLYANRHKGPIFEVYDSGLFGMYLPLMTLLGGILDIHFLQMNTTLSVNDDILAILRANLLAKLDNFENSIYKFSSQNKSGAYIQAWNEYCKCIVHIFHILVQGHMDPINLLNSIDNLILTDQFKQCTTHSISAAKSIELILLFDPDLRLIPYFFGIQLLQAGFILLCLADKLGSDTSQDVREACETIVRGHEICVVTLNTEYQRNFRAILRGAIQPTILPGMDGIATEAEEARNRRREVLGLYRWCHGGRGLAI